MISLRELEEIAPSKPSEEWTIEERKKFKEDYNKLSTKAQIKDIEDGVREELWEGELNFLKEELEPK